MHLCFPYCGGARLEQSGTDAVESHLRRSLSLYIMFRRKVLIQLCSICPLSLEYIMFLSEFLPRTLFSADHAEE